MAAAGTVDINAAVSMEMNEEMRAMLAKTVGRLAQDDAKKQVPTDAVIRYLKAQRSKASDCAQFPFMIMYFVCFTIMVYFHEDIENVSQVERNFREMIEGTSFEGTLPEEYGGAFVSGHKTMEDIDVIVDIWTYLHDAMLPLWFHNIASTKPEDVNRVLRYNQLIGGVQLQQIRREQKMCTDLYPDLGPKLPDSNVNPLLKGFSCYPNTYSKSCFGDESLGFCPDAENKSTADGGASARLLLAQDRLGGAPIGFLGSHLGFLPDGWRRWLEEKFNYLLNMVSTGDAAFAWDEATTVLTKEDMPEDRALLMGRRLQEEPHAKGVRGKSLAAVMGLSSFEGGLFTVTLHEHEGISRAHNITGELKKRGWLDVGTAWFGMKLFILNPDLGVYTHIIMNVWFPPNGMLVPYVSMSSFPAEPYQFKSVMAADATWFLLWIHLVVVTVLGLVKAKKERVFKSYIRDAWNWLEWASVAGGLVIVGLWFGFLMESDGVKTQIVDVVLGRPEWDGAVGAYKFADAAMESQYNGDVEVLHGKVAALSGFLVYYRLLICWYTILIMMRFFKAFLAQPKLAMITHTILRSGPDVAHFMIVLMLVFIAYSVAGMFLFGDRLIQFSEVGFAIMTCFFIMLGDFDWLELSEEHLITSCAWFFSFMIVVAIIMLNMFLAIIMDIYTEVKMDAEGQDAIWTQAADAVQAVWKRAGWVKQQVVLDCIIAKWDQPEVLTKESLLQMVPGMPDEQGTQIINAVDQMCSMEDTKGLSMSDAMKMVGWIKIAVQKVARRIEDILAVEREENMIQRENARLAFKAANADQSAQAMMSDRPPPIVEHEIIKLPPPQEEKLQGLDKRLSRLEEFLNDSMVFTVHRGKEMRNRLQSVEEMLKSGGLSAAPEEGNWDFGGGVNPMMTPNPALGQ
eukprot:TRINITY_DN2308_c0_g1_i7.p1 TRINITY_DN2308_c0_g1~~TRINITY_DN2308_c0_g1_i7.p1  ORF type:complete len:907 (+),score=267.77 TRINITY_DN2308_c0_g1_i7:130-2850(+)